MRHVLDSREAYQRMPKKVPRDVEPVGLSPVGEPSFVAGPLDPMWQLFTGNDDLDLLLKILREEARRAHLMRVQGWC